MKLLDRVVESTTEYIETMPKTLRKKYGQFFTSKETAVFMAGLFNILEGCIEISVLDPGAGSGILSIALLERLDTLSVKKVNLVCYENDDKIIPI
ncbi:MAG: DNA methyltransferase, partial [Ruminococcus bicirculans (ex Wegman et al. 2014)]